MAVSAVILKDTDFETVVKVTTTGTNSAASIVDASALEGVASLTPGIKKYLTISDSIKKPSFKA